MALVEKFFVKLYWYALGYIMPRGMAIEWAIVILFVLIAWFAPGLLRRPLDGVHQFFSRLAHRRRTAIAIVGVVPVLVRLALLPAMPIPEPGVHDEFSHLLLADTLASGRLTNPSHPLWEHFESIHIINRPTYNSMYTPGMGTVLAIGELAGHPWIGVCLAVGLMCSAVCWALQGWLPLGWAFFGASVLALRVGLYGQYVNSYFGGTVAAIGGALVVGALPRLMRTRRVSAAIVLGFGWVILAYSRLWESAWTALAVATVLCIWFVRSRPVSIPVLLGRVFGPIVVLAVLGIGGLGYYNWRVTGDPLLLPYEVNRATYGWPELLSFLPRPKVTHRHNVMHDQYLFEQGVRDNYASPGRIVHTTLVKIQWAWRFLFGPALTVPLLALPLVFRDRRVRYLLIYGAVILPGYLLVLVLLPQYLGPAIALTFALWASAARHVYVWFVRHRPQSLVFMRAIPMTCALMVFVRAASPQLGLVWPFWDDPRRAHQLARAEILSRLTQMPKPQLVIVRYGPQHNFHEEWVYNRADIDGAQVVWAREMDAAHNRRLIDYFHDRQIWLLEPDANPPRLTPYQLEPEETVGRSGILKSSGAEHLTISHQNEIKNR